MPPYNIPHTGTPWYSNYGNLDSATVIGFSMLYNRENAIIESVVVKDNISQVANNGGIHNLDSATIDTLIVDGSTASNSGNAFIKTANIHDGRLSNSGDAIIETLTVNGGGFGGVSNPGGVSNYGNAIIETANVNGGNVRNWRNATIDMMNLNDGNVVNGNLIKEMTYTGGTYEGQITYREEYFEDGRYMGLRDVHQTGTIGSLTVAGDSRGIDWGTVDNLDFVGNGSGFVSIGGFADGSFSGIRVTESVNMANGNFQFNLSGTVDDWFGTAFGWEDIFGGASSGSSWEAVGWEDALFRISWEDYSTDWFGQQWNLGNGYFVAFDAVGMTNAAVPEPATLAIIGLGIAGLGLARRRMKR